MQESLTISNAEAFLKSMFFTDIECVGESEKSLYFQVKDEDDEIKKVELQTVEMDKICVSVKENNEWYILTMLD